MSACPEIYTQGLVCLICWVGNLPQSALPAMRYDRDRGLQHHSTGAEAFWASREIFGRG